MSVIPTPECELCIVFGPPSDPPGVAAFMLYVAKLAKRETAAAAEYIALEQKLVRSLLAASSTGESTLSNLISAVANMPIVLAETFVGNRITSTKGILLTHVTALVTLLARSPDGSLTPVTLSAEHAQIVGASLGRSLKRHWMQAAVSPRDPRGWPNSAPPT
jgi:hypothetical protein